MAADSPITVFMQIITDQLKQVNTTVNTLREDVSRMDKTITEINGRLWTRADDEKAQDACRTRVHERIDAVKKGAKEALEPVLVDVKYLKDLTKVTGEIQNSVSDFWKKSRWIVGAVIVVAVAWFILQIASQALKREMPQLMPQLQQELAPGQSQRGEQSPQYQVRRQTR